MNKNDSESITKKSLDSSQEKITREELLRKASDLVNLLHRRTTTRRFKESEHDRPHLAYARAAIAAVTAYASILKDAELEELKARIEALETLQENKNDDNS